MTLLEQQDREVVISDQISEPVRRVAERSWALRVSHGLLQALTLGMAVALGGILAMGMLPGMPIILRIGFAVIAWCIGVWGLVRWAIPAFRRLPFFSAARAIDEANPETHERISSAIELAAEEDTRFKGSQSLINHLMKQAEEDAANIDPAQVVSGKSVLRWVGLAILILSMYGLAMLSVPRTFKEGLRGMTMPWVPGRTRPPVELKVEPGDNITVAQGESLDITATVTDPSRPDALVDRAVVRLQYANGPAQEVEMERADAQIFRTRLSAIQQNLSYSVLALGEQSPTYSVSVVPRPGVASMSVVYTFPPYTRLAPKEDKAPANGTLEALAGTRARVTIRTTQAVEADQSFLVIGQGQTTVQLKPTDPTTLTGEVPITASGTYTVNLVSMIDGRAMKSDATRTRQIVAHPDEAPRVTLTSPAPNARIRPDDTAPIRFTADDDFGMAGAELVVQVDNRPTEALPIDMSGVNGVHAERGYDLVIRDVLQHTGIRDPKKIIYYVRVKDNAQPKANLGESIKQTLTIDRNAERISLREGMAAAQATADALKLAEQKLTSAAKKLSDLEKVSAERQFSGGETQRLSEARQEMTEATQAIEKAMESATPEFQKQREELKQINDTNVRPGTEAAARAELSDDGKRRQQNISDASAQAAKARDQIAAMRQNVDQNVQDERLKKALADAAQRQEQLAREMENNNKPGEMKNRQEALKKDVEQMIRDNDALRDAAKKQAEPKVKSLVDKLSDIAQRQDKASDQIDNAAESAQANEKLKKIIAEQEKLNKDIARLDKVSGAQARAAQVPIPDENKTGNIVKSLQENQLQGAQAQQRVVANELDRVAKRATPGDDPNGLDIDTLAKDVDTLTQDIQNAKDQGRSINRPSDPENQKAYELATKMHRASLTQPGFTADQRRSQDEVRKLAQEAATAARAGRVDEAQQKLSQAMNRMQRVTPKITPQTGQQAKKLADRQRELADETAKLNEAVRQADQRKDDLQKSEAEQKQIANDIEAAAQEARQLATEVQSTTPETAEQANRAVEQLKRAAADQRKSATASKEVDLQQAAKAAKRAETEVQQAITELKPDNTPPQQAQQNQPNQPDAQQAQQQQANQAQAQQAQQAQQQGQQGEQMQQGQPQGNEAQANKQGEQGQQQAGQQGQQAQQGQQGQQNQQGQQQGQQAQAQQGQQAGQQGGQQAGQQAGGQQQGGQQGGQQQGGQSAQQQQLAQAVQEARDAQQQAAAEGSAAAAQRAAQALARAQQLAQQQGNQQQAGQQSGGQPAGQMAGGQQAPGNQQGNKSQQNQSGGSPAGNAAGSDGQPSQTAENGTSGDGTFTNGKASKVQAGDPRPAAAKEIGIAPSDWAKLPPLMQKDLLNAAQQKGPPEYQQMIKNYYTQIARMQTDGETK